MNRAMVWIGGLALLAATAFDTLSVVGRSIGMPLHGLIELSQAAILVAGSVALVAATLVGNHACVHLVIDRLPERARGGALRLSALMVSLFFAGLLAGSAWIAVDLWGAHEVSELLGVQWRWLRAFANISFIVAILILLRQAVWGKN